MKTWMSFVAFLSIYAMVYGEPARVEIEIKLSHVAVESPVFSR